MIKDRIQEDIKTAMKARESQRLGALRLISAAMKQREVDERIELKDEQVIAILDKMLKQRRESLSQYQTAGRQDLSDQEQFEIELIQQYLPAQMSEEEVDQLVQEAISQTGANSIKDMGKVMGFVKPKAQGRTDLGALGAKIKEKLG